MRWFSYGELWGPFPCEEENCGKDAWQVRLTDEENARLPEESGPVAIKYILDNKLGKVLCESCSIKYYEGEHEPVPPEEVDEILEEANKIAPDDNNVTTPETNMSSQKHRNGSQ